MDRQKILESFMDEHLSFYFQNKTEGDELYAKLNSDLFEEYFNEWADEMFKKERLSNG